MVRFHAELVLAFNLTLCLKLFLKTYGCAACQGPGSGVMSAPIVFGRDSLVGDSGIAIFGRTTQHKPDGTRSVFVERKTKWLRSLLVP